MILMGVDALSAFRGKAPEPVGPLTHWRACPVGSESQRPGTEQVSDTFFIVGLAVKRSQRPVTQQRAHTA